MSHPSEMLQSLRNQIKEADGYLPITPEYNRSTSSAMKNTPNREVFLRIAVEKYQKFLQYIDEKF